MSLRWRKKLGIVIACFLVLTFSGEASAQSPSEPGNSEWASLGPTGPHKVAPVAVSSGWPEDPFIYIGYTLASAEVPFGPTGLRAPTAAARTRDGGRTWEALPEPPPAEQIHVISTRDYGRVLLASVPPTRESPEARVLRSIDDGETWQAVSWPGQREPYLAVQLEVSPGVFDDGRVFALVPGELWESHDAGRSWQQRRFEGDARLHRFAISPSFADDRALAVAIAPARPAGLTDAEYPNWAREDAGRLRFLVSTDGGETFADRSLGLELEGVPVSSLVSIAFSPSFLIDRTIFVYGYATLDATNEEGRVVGWFTYGGIFKSQDAGESWTLAHAPVTLSQAARTASSSPRGGAAFSLHVAPDFSTSGHVVAMLGHSGRSAAYYGCTVLRSADAGVTWTHHFAHYTMCASFRFAGGSVPRLLWTNQGENSGVSWVASTDAALTSTPLGPGILPVNAIPRWWGGYGGESRIAIARDGTIFSGEVNGVWAQGDSARATQGHFPCSVEESRSLAQALRGATRTRAFLGCPIAASQEVTVRERRLGDSVDLWIEEIRGPWFSLASPQPPLAQRLGQITRLSKSARPWSGTPDRTVQGELQEYEQAIAIQMPGHSGDTLAYVLTLAGWEVVSFSPDEK